MRCVFSLLTGGLVCAFAQTPLQSLHGHVILSAAGSPYLVETSLVQTPRDTLVIEAGVRVLVDGYRKILLRGCVRIHGTASQPVIFSSADSTDSWIGLHWATGSKAMDVQELVVQNAFRNTVSASSGQMFQCRFQGNYYGLWVDDSPNLRLVRCEFQRNRYGLAVGSGILQISSSKISKNVYGIWLEGQGQIHGLENQIANNTEEDSPAITKPISRSYYSQRLLQALEARF
ncbi:MAG TPA: right-handed parallel beta-helix repeat-containing protein [Fibrobacteraceae bacterium]|nr:right-handed parallel beta-helix repeat-containing protein [Fibrobacteraceae bacterium]